MLSKKTSIIILCIALFFDVLQIILSFFAIGLVISPLINIFAQFVLWFIFKLNRVSYIGTKRLASVGISAVLELIPALDVLPTLTFEAFMIISTVNIEEKVSQTVPGGKQIVQAVNKRYSPKTPVSVRKEVA